MKTTLLIWELLHEETCLYLIPDCVITEEMRALMRIANNSFSGAYGEDAAREGLDFLTYALIPEDEADDGIFPDNYPGEWKSIFAMYKVENNPMIENSEITSVCVSGIVL